MVIPATINGFTHQNQHPYVNSDSNKSMIMDQKQKSAEEIEIAVKNIERYVMIDSSFPELADKLKIRQGIVSRSGLHEAEYLSSSFFFSVSQLKSVNKVPIPNEILEHYSRIHSHYLMGTFAEIKRAWIVLDSDLFLWDYEYGCDVAYFDGVSELIICVGLVKPKPGVFQDFVHYLLVLTTPSNIIVLGVTFSKPDEKNLTVIEEMHITQEVVYTLSTDGIVFSTIVGSDNGRIFLGAKDGCLYEFVYQKEISWWGKRCKKINHSSSTLSILIPSFFNVFNEMDEIIQISVDNSRNVLYTLSGKGSIEMYDLGENGTSMSKLATFSHSSILSYVIRIMEENYVFGPVVSISAVEVYDSVYIALVAVMESGTRIYFSTSGGTRPMSLQIAHIRMPPGYANNAANSNIIQRPTKVRTSVYSRGTCLLINAHEGCQDKLWSLSSDLIPFSPLLCETLTIVGLDGMVWSVEKYNTNLMVTSTIPEPPLFVTQHYELSTKYVCLSDKGSEIFQKLRPVDVLREIFEEGHDPGSDTVRHFLQTLNEDEVCATLLLLACQKVNEQISDVATRSFFLYGGEPKIVPPTESIQVPSPSSPFQQTLPLGFNPASVSTPIGGQQKVSPTSPMVAAEQQSLFQFSHKHNGLYIFLSRTMRPIWYGRIIQCVKIDHKVQWIIPPLMVERSVLVSNHLIALQSFVECNPNILNVPSIPILIRTLNESALGTPSSHRMLHELYMQEKISLQASKLFIARAIEVLNLLKVLYDHQFHLVAATLSSEELNFLSGITLGDLILSGLDLCNSLINKLLNLYLDDNSSVDAISTKLRDVCPTLFLIEDAACAKALEMIMFSRSKTDPDDKQKLFEDSLKILKEVSPKVNLTAICSQYMDVGFFLGIFELCHVCAIKLDPKDVAMNYYHNGGSEQSLEYTAYTQRMNCYKELTATLEYLHSKNISGRTDKGIPSPISKSFVSPFLVSASSHPDQMNFHEFLSLCLSSNDELLHSAVYTWMMSKKLHGELVSYGRSSLEFFLQQSHVSEHLPPHDVKDILWMFFERQGNHVAAANILFNLAKESNEKVSLEQRIHNLSHALVCLRSDKSESAPRTGVLFQEVEDALQVAQIQLKIQKALITMVNSRQNVEVSVKNLNSKLYNLTELYEHFAEPYNLWECQLEIIDCSNMPTQDTEIVHEIWQNIISEEINKCASSNPNDKMISVTKKIKSILRSVHQQSPIFAVEFLIFHLELVNCRLKAHKRHVHGLMSDLGVPVQKITDSYEKLYVVNSSVWEENGDEYHIITAIGSLSEDLIKNNTLSVSQRKQTALKLNDLITHCLNMLYSRPTNSKLTELIRCLKSIQNNLNKI